MMEVPQYNAMQRFPVPDDLFELSKLDDCVVQDRHGQVLCIKDIRKNYTCIIVFIRHFLDYVTKEYVEDFSKIFPRSLDEHKVKVIVIGCAPSRFIQPFCEETNFCHEMYCDSKRLIHKTLSLCDFPESFGGSSPHVKSNAFSGFFLTMWRFIKSKIEQGDPLQQGGQLVINQDGQILYFHRDSHPLDHTPINELLNVAGLPRIDFQLNYMKVHDI